MHQFLEYDDALAPWELSARHPQFADRISATLVNHALRCQANSTIPTYSDVLAGLVLSPTLIQSGLMCAYERDAGSEERLCSRQRDRGGKQCVPGCYSQVGKPKWCSETLKSHCAWPPEKLSTALVEQKRGCKMYGSVPAKRYNELLIAPHAFTSMLPKSIVAVFFIRSNSSICESSNPWVRAGTGRRCEEFARLAHSRILRQFRLQAEKFPLLRLDLTSWTKPFRTVKTVEPAPAVDLRPSAPSEAGPSGKISG